MKKMNRTYIMGIACLIFAAWIAWQTSMIPERLVSNEPGPKLFPYISAAGIAVFAVLSMIFDGTKEAKEGGKPYLDRAGWIRVGIMLAECIVFAAGMYVIGFWFTSILGLMMFIWTLKGERKINVLFAAALSVVLGTVCYFGFSKGFVIPLPKGIIWEILGISMV